MGETVQHTKEGIEMKRSLLRLLDETLLQKKGLVLFSFAFPLIKHKSPADGMNCRWIPSCWGRLGGSRPLLAGWVGCLVMGLG